MTVKELIKKLQKWHDQNAVICCPIWQVEDVLCQAENRGVKLTKNEVHAVLSLMESEHDATIGINWDVIDCWIDRVRIEGT